MRIKMITTSAGPNGVKQAGRTYEVSAAEGRSLCQGGYASPVGVAPVERAERATNPRRDTEHRGANTPGSGDAGDDAAQEGDGTAAAASAPSTVEPKPGNDRKTSASGPKSAAAVTSKGGEKHSGKGRGKGK